MTSDRASTPLSHPPGALPDDLEAVLFDLDQTLAASRTAWREGFADIATALFERHPSLAGPEGAGAFYERVFRPLVASEEATSGGDWDREFVRRPFGRLLAEHAERDDAFADALFEAYYEAWPRHIALFPDARATLETLRGRYRLGLVSNGQSREQRLKVELLGLDQHFDVVAISGELGVMKPDPAIFEHVLGRLGVAAAAAVHVGDDVHADISGAQAAGLAAVWVNRDGSTHEGARPPHAEVTALAQVAPLLGAG